MVKPTQVKLGLLIVLIVAMGVVVFHPAVAPYRSPQTWIDWITTVQGHWWTAPAYVLAYVMGVVLSFPGSVLTLVGGAAFGFVQGSVLVIVASNCGALLAFMIGRYLGRSSIQQLVSKTKGLQTALAKVETHGFQTILILRLTPIFPFNVINYAAGLSGLKLRDYALGSFMGMLPGTLVYVYFADSLMSGVAGAESSALKHLVISSVLLVTLSLIPWVVKRLKR